MRIPSATIRTRAVGRGRRARRAVAVVSAEARERRLSDEAARWRRSFREAEAALHEANLMLLSLFLQERMRDPRDFTDRVRLEDLVDYVGRIRWARVDALVGELLEARPDLAAPAELQSRRLGLQWLGTET